MLSKSRNPFRAIARLAMTLVLALSMTTVGLPENALTRTLGLGSGEALAQGGTFKALASPKDLAAFREICDDIQSVIEIIMVFKEAGFGAASANPSTLGGMAFALTERANTIAQVCSLVMAVASAQDINGVLRAARIANRMGLIQMENQLNFIEDSLSMYDFLQNLANVKDGKDKKRKILNANNYRRIIRYLQRNNIVGDGSETQAAYSAAQDRAQMMEETTKQLFTGCRRTVSNQETKCEVKGPDGCIKFITATVDGTRMDEAIVARDSALETVSRLQRVINKMLAKVVEDSDELSSSTHIVNEFMKNGMWVSVGYIPPRSDRKNEPEIAVIPNEYAKRVDGAARAVNERPSTPIKTEKIVQDYTKVFYIDQGASDASACRPDKRDTYRMESWLLQNTGVLTDPFIKAESIADAVVSCPESSQAALTQYDVSVFAADASTPEEADELEKAVAKSLGDNCNKTNQLELAKKLNELGSLATDDMTYDEYYDSSRNSDCTPDRQTEIRSRPVVFKPKREIGNVQSFIGFYNNLFNQHVKLMYSSVARNPVSEALRKYVSDPMNVAVAGRFPMNKRSQWDPNASNMLPPEQQRFNREWRTVDLCDNPTYLKRKFTDDLSKKTLANATQDAAGYVNLVNECRQMQKTGEWNDDIFQDMFYALVDELEKFHKARADVLRQEIKYGAYRSNNSLKTAGCLEELKPQDITIAHARSTALLFEEFQEVAKLLRQHNETRSAQDQAATKALQEREAKWLQIHSQDARARARLQGATNKGDTNDGYSSKNMMPSYIENRTRNKKMGDPDQK